MCRQNSSHLKQIVSRCVSRHSVDPCHNMDQANVMSNAATLVGHKDVGLAQSMRMSCHFSSSQRPGKVKKMC